MSIFKEICEWRTISSDREIRRKLTEAISRGWVEQIAVMKPHPLAPDRKWYRDTETGEIYQLDPPDERGGSWTRVDPEDLVDSNEKIN